MPGGWGGPSAPLPGVSAEVGAGRVSSAPGAGARPSEDAPPLASAICAAPTSRFPRPRPGSPARPGSPPRPAPDPEVSARPSAPGSVPRPPVRVLGRRRAGAAVGVARGAGGLRRRGRGRGRRRGAAGAQAVPSLRGQVPEGARRCGRRCPRFGLTLQDPLGGAPEPAPAPASCGHRSAGCASARAGQRWGRTAQPGDRRADSAEMRPAVPGFGGTGPGRRGRSSGFWRVPEPDGHWGSGAETGLQVRRAAEGRARGRCESERARGPSAVSVAEQSRASLPEAAAPGPGGLGGQLEGPRPASGPSCACPPSPAGLPLSVASARPRDVHAGGDALRFPPPSEEGAGHPVLVPAGR